MILFTILETNVFAQTKPFEKYNFEGGEYFLVGLQTMKGGKNLFVDTTKEF